MNIIEKIKTLMTGSREPVLDKYDDDFLYKFESIIEEVYSEPTPSLSLSSGTFYGFQTSQVINLSSGTPYYLGHHYLDRPYDTKEYQNLPRMDYAVELVPGGEILVCEYCGTRYLFDKSKVTDALRKIRCIECGGSLV